MDERREQTTSASAIRLALARQLTERCPLALGHVIAVTGSAARGIADDTSDTEINVWGDTVPEMSVWREGLEGVGATDVSLKFAGESDPTSFRWVVCGIDGIWVELGFSLIEEFDSFVGDLVAGRFIDHLRMQMGWTIEQAVPLRTGGRMAAWKEMVAAYPEGLAEQIVANQTEVWSDPHVPGVRWALAVRGERMGLALRFTWDMQNLLRVLFAINHTWIMISSGRTSARSTCRSSRTSSPCASTPCFGWPTWQQQLRPISAWSWRRWSWRNGRVSRWVRRCDRCGPACWKAWRWSSAGEGGHCLSLHSDRRQHHLLLMF
ncbi:MAG TPA: hypothetical protein VFB34_08760 [Chloroflexota bacterium]|nr:hypothetical protein [Chloroflexota bacterium]